MRRPLLLIVGLVLLVRLPFLNQAIQGDDVYYLAGAEHAQIDPAHPNNARYVFLGQTVDMRGHPHPPLNVWCLAALLALLGDIREVSFHAAYILFSLIAALAVWSLARRFSSRPLWATLLFLVTPAFVVNGNSFESDVPFLAFWMAATALFVLAVDRRSRLLLAACGVSLGLAALAAYQAVILIPVLACYLLLNQRRWRAAWMVLLTPALTLAAWQVFERVSGGPLPASVLAGYFQAYGWQAFSNKLKNAAALTAHSAWILFPALALLAFRKVPRWSWILIVAAAAGGAAWLDANPLFWASFAIGLLIIIWCVARASSPASADRLFLTAWALLFFGSALVLFFAGSARYLLPMAAPVVLLAVGELPDRTRWLAAGFALQLVFSLSLSVVNYQHWDGYRAFVRSLDTQFQHKRVWINGEWGLRYYAEAEGGLPLIEGQAVRPGEIVLSSKLAFPIHFTTGGGALTLLAEREIRSPLPFRLIALDTHSAYSTVSLGFRPFDLSTSPIDIVRADVVIERKPALDYLPMNAPEAESQIVSGIYQLEDNRWRWMGERGVVLLKRPPSPLPLRVVFYIPQQSPARHVTLSLDGRRVAESSYSAPGSYTLSSSGPLTVSGESATAVITVDQTFSVPGDHRRLGLVLSEVGFRD